MEKNVEEYLNGHKLQFRDAADIVEEFTHEIGQMHGTCIDIGCGPGDVSNELLLPKLPRDADLVGADISDEMVEHARKKYGDNERLYFVQLDIEATNLPTEEIARYDNALSFYCLHWCQNSRRAFENIYKLLRAGGRALVMFLANNNGFDAYVRVHENPRYRPYMQDAHEYVPFFHRCNNSRAALRKILEDTGFEVLHCSKREKSFVYQNAQILKKHVLAVNPFVSRMPDDLKEEFEDVLLREIMSGKIIFSNETEKCEEEYSILDRYYILVAYVKKP